MPRLVLAVATAVTAQLIVAGCSQSTTATLGYADQKQDTRTVTRPRSGGASGLGASPEELPAGKKRPEGERVASLDKAPNGTFEKAPTGALSDRDYSGVRLDAEQARELVNAYRKKHGLKPVTLNVDLTNAAKAHSRDLARWDRISHYGSDGSNPWDRVKRAGYNARLAAENVGTGQTSIDEVFKGWQQSPGHNKNLLLADAEHMGVALVHDPKTEFKTFWTLVLAARLGQ